MLPVRREELNLDHNALAEEQSVPEELYNVKQLTSLSIQNNGLHVLRPGISRLSSLQSLYLKNNKLNAMPADMDNLVNLTVLDQREAEIRRLRQELSEIAAARGA